MCRLDVVDTGHFVWEEAAPEYASIIVDWLTSGYRSAATAPAGSRS